MSAGLAVEVNRRECGHGQQSIRRFIPYTICYRCLTHKTFRADDLISTGGKHFWFFNASQFSLQWLCLDADKLIIGIVNLWKLLYGSILSSMNSRVESTRPTQFVRCVDLNLNTLATQLIWETTLRYTTQNWESNDLLQMPTRERSSRWWHSFN